MTIVVNRQDFFDLLATRLSPDDLEQIGAAYEFSKYGHRNQFRDDGGRYFDHPRSVALIIFEELKLADWQMIVAALLHDIREDSYILTEQRIALNFGTTVAGWIKLLTKESGVDYHARLQSCRIWQVWVLKLSDRLHNLRTLDGCTPEKCRRQITETREVYIPLAEQLLLLLPPDQKHVGQHLKREIEALCDRYDANP
ncbi:MAG: HD domain-containing protein [Candidatus Buchananbacteria bacterium]|nr:HD domain-containing protein [Candidatus Buchananbacteria bacterium]